MKIFLLTLLVAGVVALVTKWISDTRKYLRFVKNNPDEAYIYFKNHPNEWLVFEVASIDLIRNQLPSKITIGPWQFYVPQKRRIVTVFGHSRKCMEGLDKLCKRGNTTRPSPSDGPAGPQPDGGGRPGA